MKILHVGKYYHPYKGGMESYLKDLAQSQVLAGNEVTILVHNSKNEQIVEFIEGIKVTKVATLANVLYTPISPTFLYYLVKEIKRFKPDIVHLHLPNPSAFYILPLIKKYKLIVHWHSDIIFNSNEKILNLVYKPYSLFENLLLKKADNIIATSPPYANFSPVLTRYKSKVTVIPLGIDTKRLQSFTEKEARDKLNLLFIGRFSHYKGIKYLVCAMSEVHKAELHLVGDGECFYEIKNQIKQLGLNHKIFLHGRTTDTELANLFAKTDCLVLPSIERTEAFGVVLLEAMSKAIPLITTKIEGSGTSWVNQDNKTGFVVPIKDSVALAAAINKMCEKDIAKKLGKVALHRFNEKFHIQSTEKEIAKLYLDK